MSKKIRKYSINDLDGLINSIKTDYGLKEEEISIRLGYNEGYISQTRARGFVPDKFMESLKREFAKSNNSTLQNIGLITHSKPHGGANDPYKDKYIESLERENRRLDRDLQLSLGELRHNALLARSVAETNQQLLIEILAKQRRIDLDVLSVEVGKANGENYKKMKEESRFGGVHS